MADEPKDSQSHHSLLTFQSRKNPALISLSQDLRMDAFLKRRINVFEEYLIYL